jgi:lipoprotein-anchoring transpeptidase ErfK/SrfK
LKDAINKVYALGEERETELKKAAVNYDKFTASRQQQAQQREAQDFEQIKSEVEAIQKQIPWANEPKKPVNPTPEAMAKYQKEASQWEQNTKRFHMYLNPPDAKTRAQAALAATGYFKVTEDMKALQAENATLRNQIAKLQSVGKTTTAQAPAPKPAPKKDYLGMDDADALDALMKEMGH